MNHNEFFQELQRGVIRNVYFFSGSELLIQESALRKLTAAALSPGLEDLNRIQMDNPDVRQIQDVCDMAPMMDRYRLVICRELGLLGQSEGEKKKSESKGQETEAAQLLTYLDRIPSTTILVILAGGGIDKRRRLTKKLLSMPGSVTFDPLSDPEMVKWMNQQLRHQGSGISSGAAQRLMFLSGRDMLALQGELEKLAAYAGQGNAVTLEAVEQVATRSPEARVFDMIDNLCDGKMALALEQLQTLLEEGNARLGILALMTRQYRLMFFVARMQAEQTPQAEMARVLGIAPFVLSKIQKRIRREPPELLRRQYRMCVQAELDMKAGNLREEIMIETLMLTLNQMQREG